MSGSSPPNATPWFERTVIAALVIVGFAVGSLGLTIAAEIFGDDPVLTDEFNAPVAEDDATEEVVTVAVEPTTTTTTPSTTTTTTTDPQINPRVDKAHDKSRFAHDRRR